MLAVQRRLTEAVHCVNEQEMEFLSSTEREAEHRPLINWTCSVKHDWMAQLHQQSCQTHHNPKIFEGHICHEQTRNTTLSITNCLNVHCLSACLGYCLCFSQTQNTDHYTSSNSQVAYPTLTASLICFKYTEKGWSACKFCSPTSFFNKGRAFHRNATAVALLVLNCKWWRLLPLTFKLSFDRHTEL